MSKDDVSFAAAEWTGSEFRLTDVPAAQPGDGEVRVRVAACAVCLTAVHCIDVLADDGRVVVFGVNWDTDVLDVPVYRFHRRNLSLITSFGAERADAAAAAELLFSLALEPLISHRYELTEVAAAFDAARTGAGLKVLVYPSVTQASRCEG